MQGDLVVCRRRASILFMFGDDAFCNSLVRVRDAQFLLIAVLIVFGFFPDPGYCVETAQPEFRHLFHLVGIPGLRRDERVDLNLSSDGLSFTTKDVQYQVPYARIHHVLLMNSDRRYEGRTYAAAVATYGVGALLILKKHHVDTVVLDYVNERGGKMGIVLQMETSQGELLKSLLKSRDIVVEDPKGVSESPPKQQTGTQTKDRSKP